MRWGWGGGGCKLQLQKVGSYLLILFQCCIMGEEIWFRAHGKDIKFKCQRFRNLSCIYWALPYYKLELTCLYDRLVFIWHLLLLNKRTTTYTNNKYQILSVPCTKTILFLLLGETNTYICFFVTSSKNDQTVHRTIFSVEWNSKKDNQISPLSFKLMLF